MPSIFSPASRPVVLLCLFDAVGVHDLGISALHLCPADHIGRSYRPTGPELLSPQDIAEGARSTVTYKDVPFKMFHKAATAQGFSPSDMAHVRYYAEELRSGAFAIGAPTDHVRAVGGTEPEDFESTVRRYVQNPSIIHPGLEIGSKPKAIGFLFKMLATRPD